ncbi:MAG TPA: NYN domain-containing protein [Gemmatimonadales bacterium]|nr:NYN domain-containing protein [Gemmatimonadales bacterium]
MEITPLRPPRAAHAEPPAHAPNAALMIDFDNVTLAIRSDLSAQLRKLLQSDIFKGKVSVQRAYADWRRYPQYIVPLSEASIDLIFAPAFGSNKKNATDIRLAIDALELVFIRPEIGTFILLSGDSDFSSLVLKLKEYGKFVIGVGIRESSSDLLVQNCDEYYSYSELTGLTKQTDADYPHKDPWELVVEAVTHMKSEGDVMRSDRLKQVMQQLDPSFDEKEAGFSRFSKFVAEAGSRGLLRLTKQENGQYQIDLGSNANVSPAVEAELARRPPQRQRAPRVRERAAGASGAMTLAVAFHLLKETLATMGALENEVEAERVRDGMIERTGSDRDPVFERARFQRLLRQAHDANLVELTKGGEGQYFLKLNPEALVEDRVEPGADAPPTEAEGSDADADAGRRRRRGRRGGRGRGRREDAEPSAQADLLPDEPAAHRERQVEPPIVTASPVSSGPEPAGSAAARRNPRFRHGSRGPVTPAGGAERPAEAQPEVRPVAPPASPPAPTVAGPARSLRPRGGSRGGGRAPVSGAAERRPERPPEPPREPRAAPVERAPAAPAASPASPAADEAAPSGLLKRVTAALQRAVRGSGQEKSPGE